MSVAIAPRSSSHPAAAPARAETTCPRDTATALPAEVPAPPADGVDFSTLDSPRKVALLPAFNAATLVDLLENLGDALDAGQPLHGTFEGTAGATPLRATFTLADPASGIASVEGTLGPIPFQETWQTNAATGTITIDGHIGATPETLTLRADDEATRIDGTVGAIAVHQTITAESDGGDVRFIFEGAIGDQEMHQEVHLAWGRDRRLHLETVGTLGDQPIATSSTRVPADDAIEVKGQGIIAGTNVTFTQQMR